MLIQTKFYKSKIVTQSEAKSLEYTHEDVHEILHYTTFRSGWQITTLLSLRAIAKSLEHIAQPNVDAHEILRR